MAPKSRYFWPLLFVVFLTDCTTKDLAIEHLIMEVPQQFLTSIVRLTLIHNPGTAFGFDLRPYIGDSSRFVMVGAMLTILLLMMRMYWRSAPRARTLGAALGLVCGGAAGNVFDRLRFPLGVVDFIDVGVGAHRFWIFNVADAAITVGAFTLALVLLRENADGSPPAEATV